MQEEEVCVTQKKSTKIFTVICMYNIYIERKKEKQINLRLNKKNFHLTDCESFVCMCAFCACE